MFLVATGSYKWIETPFRKTPWGSKSSVALTFGFTLKAAAFTSIYSLFSIQRLLLQIGDKILGERRIEDAGIIQADIYCHYPKRSDSAILDCLGGANSERRSIYIIGDSHASNHFTSIKEAVAQLGQGTQAKVLIDYGFDN